MSELLLRILKKVFKNMVPPCVYFFTGSLRGIRPHYQYCKEPGSSQTQYQGGEGKVPLLTFLTDFVDWKLQRVDAW